MDARLIVVDRDEKGVTISSSLKDPLLAKVMSSMRNINDFATIYALYEMVAANFVDLEKSLEAIEGIYREQPLLSHQQTHAFTVTINRRVMNLLSSIRSFLDHNQRRIEKDYGETSPEMERFITATNTEYNQHFEYKLAYHLRNYAQHAQTPIDYITLGKDKPTGDTRPGPLSVCFVRDSLLGSKTLRRKIGKELRNADELIPVWRVFGKEMKCLKRLNTEVSSIREFGLRKDTDTIKRLLYQHRKNLGRSFIIENPKADGDSQAPEWIINDWPMWLLDSSVIELPLHFVGVLDHARSLK